MRTGPKALVGLGLPAALRPHTPDKGVGGGPYAFTFNGQPFTFAGITFTYGAPA